MLIKLITFVYLFTSSGVLDCCITFGNYFCFTNFRVAIVMINPNWVLVTLFSGNSSSRQTKLGISPDHFITSLKFSICKIPSYPSSSTYICTEYIIGQVFIFLVLKSSTFLFLQIELQKNMEEPCENKTVTITYLNITNDYINIPPITFNKCVAGLLSDINTYLW